MPTLMSESTFESFRQIRTGLIRDGFGPATNDAPGPLSVFVPWAGCELRKGGALYVVGAALDQGSSTENWTYLESLRASEDFCQKGPHSRDYTPFWRFIDRLSMELLRGPYHATAERWGWSNLLKIGWSDGAPGDWPDELKQRQGDACVLSLREELNQLSQSLVFIAYSDTFGILPELLDASLWNRDHEAIAGIWWQHDPERGNLFLHGYHPKAARLGRFFDAAIDCSVRLARDRLSPFQTVSP